MASLTGEEIVLVATATERAGNWGRAFELWLHLCDNPVLDRDHETLVRYTEGLAAASVHADFASLSAHTRQRFRSVCAVAANYFATRGNAAAVLRWMHLAQERVSKTHLLYDNNIHRAAYTLSTHPDDVAFSDDALAVYRWCEYSMRDLSHDDMGVLHFACLLVRPDVDWGAFAATRIASRTPWKTLCAAETRAQMIEAIWDWLDIAKTWNVGAQSILHRVLDRRFPRTLVE